jgi:ABC-2 type transport system permease protein
MWKLLKIELFKIFRRPRTYIAFAAIGAIIFLIQAGMFLDGDLYMEFILQSVSEGFVIEGKKNNGYFVCFIILQLLLVHVPLLIALVAGDIVAGEANMGTLRLMMTKPISRAKFMFSKFIAASVYTLLLLVFVAFLGLVVSLMIFGDGDLINLKSGMVILLDRDDILWRYFCALGFAAFAMITVTALAFLFSVFAENSVGPIIATMAVIIVFTILQTLDIPFFNATKPFLFTNHMLRWKDFFDMKVNAAGQGIPGTVYDIKGILNSVLVLTGHIVFFVSLAILVFRKKDILS